MIEEEIEKTLKTSKINNEGELRAWINNTKLLIHHYSLKHPESDLTDKWTQEMMEKIKNEKSRIGLKKVDESKNREMFETVKLASRQVGKATVNVGLLEKSTLKLMGLNYSSKELEEEINKTGQMLMKKKRNEKKEILWLYCALILFIIVCVFIICDKFLSRFGLK